MHSSAIFYLLLAALLDTASSVELRKIEFDILKTSRSSLFLFTANGCNECDRVQAVLDEAYAALRTFPIATVNCRNEPDACDESQIFTVPTIKYATGTGDLVLYREATDVSSVVKYIERQLGSPVQELSKDTYLDFAASSRVAVLAFLGPSASAADRQAFETVANQWRTHYSFGSVDEAPGDDSAASSVAVYSQDRDEVVHYRGDFNAKDIEAFLQEAATPLIYEFDPVVHEELVKDAKPLAHIFFKQHGDRAELAKLLFPVAKKFKDQMNFVTALASDYHQQCEKMHLDKDATRGFAIADSLGRAYPLNSTEFSVDQITKHIEAYLAGTVAPTIKSEPVPEVSEELPFVTTLVGSNFDELAFDESRDVLIQFGVPWCDYCNNLVEVMNQLGSKYADSGYSGKVALATINVEDNDVPIQIDSYPSLRLYRAETNEVVPFKGSFHEMLTVEQLDAFISGEGAHAVSVVTSERREGHEEL